MTVQRLQPFGETIFATMTARAVEFNAINLGQGFPDSDGPTRMLEIAREEIAAGNNQYGPGRGMLALREAISRQRLRDYNVAYDPDTEVLVTVGATEGITATVLGLVEPGSEVIVLEPYYDAYAAAIALAGAHRVSVPLVTAGNSWTVDVDAVRAAITDRTAMIIVNSPHNPTGSVFAAADLEELAEVAVSCDLLVLSDEVYEHLLFDDHTHTALASLPGMFERTVTVSSAAKTFNATGWKTGWALAPVELMEGIIKAKQFMTYVGATPFQPAVAWALDNAGDWLQGMVAELAEGRDLLQEALRATGLQVHDTHGTYFTVVDLPTGYDGVKFCMDLPEKAGLAAIPVEVFTDQSESWRRQVRFAFCKKPETLSRASSLLAQLSF
ncbi:pyridoxal phosphate-dependent aminotransferase [Corynebacterium breve]|uniref:Pyridoxal phosphate-dependent aminotransferase n=1 Tax=Corynebacterium breve TaxID=3049799 RepID=A0ABY8VLC1_9CORY|nr:pyridoxal phosphate-dependent aminotransferase [Corynebacterium breve]WIM68345.1 pyridoxal phosphate-dependent aminotransferase [Corynebacterium breve]